MSEATVAAPARPPTALPVFALVLASLIGFLPSSARPALTVLIVVVLVATAVGLPLLVRRAVQGDLVARLALGLAAWTLISAAASGAPLAWTGEFFTATGGVFTVGVVAYWAIGRGLDAGAVPAVAAGFLAGAAVNSAVAVVQGLVDLSEADIYLYDDRSTGLLGNPVFLGAVAAAAVALLPSVLRRSAAGGVALGALLATATQMSGSRSSIVVLILAGIWAATRCRRWVGLALIAALAVGLVAGGALQQNEETSAAARLQTTSGLGGLGPRLLNWKAGAEAAFDRPLTGYGPGRWRAATSPRRTLTLAREVGPDRLYADAHNLPIEYLGTTGFVGAGLLLAFLIAVVLGLRRGAQPELTVAALCLLAYHALEPQHATITPLMLLLAGAAAPRTPVTPPRRALRGAQAVLVALAVVLGGRLVLGDLTYRSADLDFALGRMQRASSLLWPWPNPVNAEGRIHAFRARTEKRPEELTLALEAARRARQREPDNPLRTIAVAAFLGQTGRHGDAAEEYRRALALNPWSRLALTGRSEELRAAGRRTQAAACRTASEIARHATAGLERSRRLCLAPDAERERP
jgi:O-antigen ligase